MIKSILLFVVDCILSIFAIPFFLIVFSPLLLYKLCVITFAKIFAPELTPLEVCDSYTAWDILRPKNGRLVYSVGVTIRVNGIIKLEGIQKRFLATLIEKDESDITRKSKNRLLEYIVSFGGYAFFKQEENFDINRHIRIVKLDEPIDNFVSHWIEAPYPKNASPWEIIVIHNKVAEETYLLMKNHHALGDGYSQLYLFSSFVGEDLPDCPKEREDSTWEKIRQLLAVTRVSTMFSLEVLPTAFTLPWKKDCIDGKTFRSSILLYTADIKEVFKKTGASFNAIALAVFGGLLTRILEEDGEVWKESKSTCVALSLPWPNHPINRMCNHWTTAGVQVPLGPISSLERLKLIQDNYKKYLDRDLHKMMKRFLLPPGSLFPVRFGRQGYEIWRKISGLRTIFTSVMAFNEIGTSFIDGNPVISVSPTNSFLGTTPVLSGVGFCYKDYFECSFNASEEVAENQEILDKFIKEYFPEEFEKLIAEISDESPV